MTQSGFDTKLVKDLARILRDTDLSEIEVENQGVRVRVVRQANVTPIVPAPQPIQLPVPVAKQPSVTQIPPSPHLSAPATASSTGLNKHQGAVPSPMVGTVYTQPEPGASAFVTVGDSVKEGQQLFIIEAMKTMNPVLAPCAGIVTAILVHDAQPVEYGEALCVIE
ncbi:acetyl-CoA carboxylase biotin carboxyl carrier protein [Candidatus Phycosocius spiralis]|uniref:Biotin carboxyl carrier protein of acetyl-CoA carboxylase n=1 Tax=Candidatus Phycosocius spiralis TaxID=2815099 RepID=A0ABQ4PW75_9PROT|nr:acetyl-CoA carboxylase biotin carboxyl carrier protein [Candidatus Phycosocius spiralis]GIU67268.1 acetyl-CoA carboxylase biotin carboxyl carrier protein subunit [Candidatus Phycosocius spiralis]